jgi:GrpB-like predicted nucleotidyltransferase (UPF0157 family)
VFRAVPRKAASPSTNDAPRAELGKAASAAGGTARRETSDSVRRIARERLHFRAAHTLCGPIALAFEPERAKIQALLPQAEVLHTGATSVAAALTRGDLDIHVRVMADDFSRACERLAHAYVSYRMDMWTAGFATFVAADTSIPTGVALTAIGDEHDQRFVVGWDRLRSDLHLLAEYNALKLNYEAAPDATSYEAAKSAFFSALVEGDRRPRTRPD